MPELYPAVYHEIPIAREAGYLRDVGTRLGMCAIRSEPLVVAEIAVPDEDIEQLLGELPASDVFAPSHAWVEDHAANLNEDNAATARKLVASFDAVMEMEEVAHGLLRRGDRLNVHFSRTRGEQRPDHDIHLDAGKPYRERRSRLGRTIPTGYYASVTYGTVRYVASFGPEAEEGGTRFAIGPVGREEWRNRAGLVARMRPYPAGSVIRFMSESGVHQRSPHIRPRVFVTDDRWRETR